MRSSSMYCITICFADRTSTTIWDLGPAHPNTRNLKPTAVGSGLEAFGLHEVYTERIGSLRPPEFKP